MHIRNNFFNIYIQSDKQVDRNRPAWQTGRSHWQVDRRVSLGRSRLILHWKDKRR